MSKCVKDNENVDVLIKLVSDLVRTRLGVGREMSLVDITRLGCTRVEVGGWPPVLLSFDQPYDRDVVLNKAQCLDRTGLMVWASKI